MTENELIKVFKENINTISTSRGYTQTDVSRGTGINKQSISDWFLGKSYPRPHNMQQLADFLGVSINDLVAKHEKPLDKLEREGVRILFDSAKDLSDEALKEVLDYVEFVKSKYNK